MAAKLPYAVGTKSLGTKLTFVVPDAVADHAGGKAEKRLVDLRSSIRTGAQ